ncbi:MAG: ATP-binding cassette domain-containing protein [Ginsengibacter sp.]
MQIHLRNIVPEYIEKEKRKNSEIWAQDITFTKGDHVHIVAPSGTGKTSLIHFIYGLRSDYNGSICYNNEEIKKLSSEQFSQFRQNKISIIFQDLRLFENQTVRENIEIKRRLNPYHPPEMIEKMALQLGIESKLEQSAKTCSYGEQQRIAIIRSLMQPFDFLLLDEPFSHLDNINKKKALVLISEECKKRDAAMILVDLEPEEVLKSEKKLML